MADYLIEGEILSAIADTVRGYVSGISPEGSPGDPMTLNIDVNVYYREFIDYNSTYDGLVEGGDNDTFVAFAYLQNNEGVTVPVLYDTDIGNYEQPDTAGPFFYEGTAEIDGVVYDKWRKIEFGDDSTFTWDSVAKQYIYTDVIVGLSPAELPLMIDNVYDTGYTVGYGDGYAEGEANGTGGYNEGYSAGYSTGHYNGVTDGKQAQYNEFWKGQANNTDWIYRFAGRCWNEKTFKPPFDLNLSWNCYGCFLNNGAKVDLVQMLADSGHTFSTTGITNAGQMFQDCCFTRVGIIDASKVTNIGNLFYNAIHLHTIDKFILKSDGSQSFSNTIRQCYELVNLTIEGTIGQNGLDLQWSTKLSKASITSVINALSTTTSGLSITLSKTAVETAFPKNNGLGNVEWGTLVAKRSNWTINLL